MFCNLIPGQPRINSLHRHDTLDESTLLAHAHQFLGPSLRSIIHIGKPPGGESEKEILPAREAARPWFRFASASWKITRPSMVSLSVRQSQAQNPFFPSLFC